MKIFNYFIAATAISVAIFATSCRQEQYTIEEIDQANVPTEDQLTERLSLPTVVIGSAFSDLGKALINRCENRQSQIDGNTMVVIFDTDTIINNIENKSIHFAKAQEVYDRGGVIICENRQNHDVLDDAKIYMYTNHSDQCFVREVVTEDADNLDIEFIGENNETTIPEPNSQQSTPYQLGLTADLMVNWIETVSTHKVQKSARAANTNDYNYAGQTVTDIYNAYYDKNSPTAPYQITYTIKSFYSFSEDADYYVVHEEIIGSNQPMWKGTWDKGNSSGYYLGCIYSENWLETTSGTPLKIGQAELHDTKPTSSESTTSYNSGISLNIGGQVGTSMTGPEASINTGISINESRTVSIPDVQVINRSFESSGKGGSNGGLANAFWEYDVKKRNAYESGLKIKVEDAPTVSTSTIVLHNYWYWTVPNPKQYGEKLNLKTQNSIIFAYTWVKNKFFSYEWGNPTSGMQYHKWIGIDPPLREKK